MDKNTRAWMIDKKGNAYPVTVHIYGADDDIEETLYAGEWLYDHLDEDYVKQDVLTLLRLYYDEDLGGDIEDDTDFIESCLLYQMKELGYRVISNDFIKKASPLIEGMDVSHVNYDDAIKKVNNDLNENFLRARYGGKLDSDGIGEMYFRVSSTRTNWLNVIWNFVYENKNSIDNVTVCHDAETRGDERCYVVHGQAVDKMPTEEFLMMQGNPQFESYKLEESSMSRLFDLARKHDFVCMSADKYLPQRTPEQSQHDFEMEYKSRIGKQKKLDHRAALLLLKGQGYSVVNVKGFYSYNDQSTKEENSFVVINMNDDKDFLDKCLEIAVKAKQNCIFYVSAGTNIGFWVYTGIDLKQENEIDKQHHYGEYSKQGNLHWGKSYQEKGVTAYTRLKNHKFSSYDAIIEESLEFDTTSVCRETMQYLDNFPKELTQV